MNPDPVSFEQFLGWIVFIFKTYFWIILGFGGFCIVIGTLITLTLFWRKRKRLAKFAERVAEGISQLF